MAQHQQERFRFESQAVKNGTFHVVRFAGTEGLNRLYRFEITLASALTDIDLDALLRNPARLLLLRNGNDAIFSGLISSVTQDTQYNGYIFYTVVLQPHFWKLTQVVQNRIYLDKNLQETVKDALNFNDALHLDTRFNLLGTEYPKYDFSLQYNETIYNYCANKLENEGVYYFFEANPQGEGDRVVFTDSSHGHLPLADTPSLMYSPVTGMEASHAEEVITAFSLRKTPLPQKVILRAYDWKKPNTPVEAEATISEQGFGDIYYSDNNFITKADGQRLAEIRAEELRCQGTVFSGVSAVPTLRPGFLFTLERHYQASFNREYMITEVSHEGSQEGFLSSVLGIKMEHGNDYYYYCNNFNAIRSSDQFRPPRITPRVKMQGMVTAFIDAAGKSTKPEIDSHGRYKVIFSFDTSGRKAGKASCWLRMSQPHVGAGYGTAFPLTPGIEVTVSFMDGNPDKPLITGALTNTESGPLVNNTNNNTAGISTASGNSLIFNEEDTKQGIALATASGRSGLRMSSGSTDYMQQSSDYNIWATNLLSTNLGGVGTMAWSAFRQADVIGMGELYSAMQFGSLTFDALAQAFSAKGADEDAQADKTGKETGDYSQSSSWDAIGWKAGAASAKSMALFLPLLLRRRGIIRDTSYGYQIISGKDTVKRVMLQSPSVTEFVAQTIIGFAGSIITTGVSQGAEALQAESDRATAEKAALKKQQVAYNKMVTLINKYDNHKNINKELDQPNPINATCAVCTIATTAYSVSGSLPYTYKAFIPTRNAELAAKYSTEKANDLKEFMESYEYVCNGGYAKDIATSTSKYENAKLKAKRAILSSSMSDLLPELITFCLSFWPVLINTKGKEMGGILMDTDSNMLTHSVQDTFVTADKHILLQAGTFWETFKEALTNPAAQDHLNLSNYLQRHHAKALGYSDNGRYIMLDATTILEKAEEALEWVNTSKTISAGQRVALLVDHGSAKRKAVLTEDIKNIECALRCCQLLAQDKEILKSADKIQKVNEDIQKLMALQVKLQAEKNAQNGQQMTSSLQLATDPTQTRASFKAQANSENAQIILERSKDAARPGVAPVETIMLTKEGIGIRHKPTDSDDVVAISLMGDSAQTRKIILKIGTPVSLYSIVLSTENIILKGNTEDSGKIELNAEGIILSGKNIQINAGTQSTKFTAGSITFPPIDIHGGNKIQLG